MQIKRGGVFAVIIFVPRSSKESSNEKTFLRREISVIISFGFDKALFIYFYILHLQQEQ